MQVNDCVWSGALRWLFGIVANKERLTAVAQCEETRDINSFGRQTTCIITGNCLSFVCPLSPAFSPTSDSVP